MYGLVIAINMKQRPDFINLESRKGVGGFKCGLFTNFKYKLRWIEASFRMEQGVNRLGRANNRAIASSIIIHHVDMGYRTSNAPSIKDSKPESNVTIPSRRAPCTATNLELDL